MLWSWFYARLIIRRVSSARKICMNIYFTIIRSLCWLSYHTIDYDILYWCLYWIYCCECLYIGFFYRPSARLSLDELWHTLLPEVLVTYLHRKLTGSTKVPASNGTGPSAGTILTTNIYMCHSEYFCGWVVFMPFLRIGWHTLYSLWRYRKT